MLLETEFKHPWWVASLLLAAAALGWGITLLPTSAVIGLILAGVALGGALLTLRQPLFGLAVVLLIAPVAAYERRIGLTAGLPLSSGQLLFFALMGVWGLRWALLKRTSLPRFQILWPLLLFIVVSSLSLLNGASLDLGIKELLKWVEILLIIWFVLDITRDNRPKLGNWPFWLAVVIAIPAVVQGIIGFVQFVRPDGPESFLILGNFYRAFGTFEQPNPFGGYLGMHALFLIGLALGWGLDHWTRPDEKLSSTWIWIGITLAAAGIMGVGLIASWSRGAWLGFLAGLGVMAFFWPRRPWVGAILVVVGLVGLIGLWQTGLLPDSITARIASSAEFEFADLRDIQLTNENFALLERLAFWTAAAEMAEQNLWLGVGFGAYDAAYPDFAAEGWPKSLGHAHNTYLNLLAEIGILGFILYVLFWSVVLVQAVRIRYATKGWAAGMALGLTATWTALSVHHLVDKLTVNNIYLALGTLLALQQLLARESGD